MLAQVRMLGQRGVGRSLFALQIAVRSVDHDPLGDRSVEVRVTLRRMPVEFLTDEQAEAYGKFAEEPTGRDLQPLAVRLLLNPREPREFEETEGSSW
jgi:hypothetical protein